MVQIDTENSSLSTLASIGMYDAVEPPCTCTQSIQSGFMSSTTYPRCSLPSRQSRWKIDDTFVIPLPSPLHRFGRLMPTGCPQCNPSRARRTRKRKSQSTNQLLLAERQRTQSQPTTERSSDMKSIRYTQQPDRMCDDMCSHEQPLQYQKPRCEPDRYPRGYAVLEIWPMHACQWHS